MSSTWIGVLLGLAGNFIQSSGFIAQKTGHNRCNKLNESLPKEEHKSVLTQWIWWVGIVVYTIGGGMNTAALNFAAQTIIASFGAVNLMFIAILSHFILGEKLSLKDVVAIAVIATGVVMVVVFGPDTESDEELTISTLRTYFEGLPYILLVTLLSVFTIVIFIALQYELRMNTKEMKRHHEDNVDSEKREPVKSLTVAPNFVLFACVWISAFFASNNTLFIKASVSLFASSVESKDNFQTNLTDPLSYLVVLLFPICMLSMEWFRQKALSLFGAIYVVPLFEVLCITLTSVIGMVYFEEYVGFQALDVALYLVGIITVIVGVLVLSLDVAKIWSDLYDDAIKTAFVDPDEADYKFPRTVVFGGGTSEFFAMKQLQARRFSTFRGKVLKGSNNEDEMIDHVAGQMHDSP